MRDSGRLTLRPIGLSGAAEKLESARCLAGGNRYFSGVEVAMRRGSRNVAKERLALEDLTDWSSRHGVETETTRTLQLLTAPRAEFAGMPLDQPVIMGIINVTPDSFSDGGDRHDPKTATADGLAMWEAGAAILDVGGESTRPGAKPVGEEEELSRVLPVVSALVGAGARVSIDSRRARVIEAALEAGASVVNDVTALTGDPNTAAVVARAGAPVILMHMLGDPRTMQQDPRYDDVVLDIYDYLEMRIAEAEAAGIPRQRIAVDPGIGFGKTVHHNLRLLEELAVYHGLGCPILLGASRKSFIGKLSDGKAPKERLPGSLAAVLAGLARGCQIFRVHDVAETRQAIAVWQAIEGKMTD